MHRLRRHRDIPTDQMLSLFLCVSCMPSSTQADGRSWVGVGALFGEILPVLHHPIVSGHHGQDIIIR